MRREESEPRPSWQRRVSNSGLVYHTTPQGQPYWDESACYVFSPREVDTLELATDTLHAMCLELVQRVIDERLYPLFLIPPEFEPLIEKSWADDEPTIYGRFDLAFDGSSPPKLLEYNADTPTALLEASVTQWDWLQDTDPGGDQFNSIDEKLVEHAWPIVSKQSAQPIHFLADRSFDEDATTVDYLRDTAMRAGVQTFSLDISGVGYDSRKKQFVGGMLEPIRRAFKLYPWEWLVRDRFAQQILVSETGWMEPAWKMILSAKAILPLLCDMFPESPYLLESSFTPIDGDAVRKPVLGREGANVALMRDGRTAHETGGPYDATKAVVYQRFGPLFQSGGQFAVIGSWVIAGQAAGVGMRESESPITGNTSRFVPHRMG